MMSAVCVRCLCCSSHVVLETLIFLHVIFRKASEMQGIDLFMRLCIKDALGISCVSLEVTAIRWGEGNATDRRNDRMEFTFRHFDVEMLNFMPLSPTFTLLLAPFSNIRLFSF